MCVCVKVKAAYLSALSISPPAPSYAGAPGRIRCDTLARPAAAPFRLTVVLRALNASLTTAKTWRLTANSSKGPGRPARVESSGRPLASLLDRPSSADSSFSAVFTPSPYLIFFLIPALLTLHNYALPQQLSLLYSSAAVYYAHRFTPSPRTARAPTFVSLLRIPFYTSAAKILLLAAHIRK